MHLAALLSCPIYSLGKRRRRGQGAFKGGQRWTWTARSCMITPVVDVTGDRSHDYAPPYMNIGSRQHGRDTCVCVCVCVCLHDLLHVFHVLVSGLRRSLHAQCPLVQSHPQGLCVWALDIFA